MSGKREKEEISPVKRKSKRGEKERPSIRTSVKELLLNEKFLFYCRFAVFWFLVGLEVIILFQSWTGKAFWWTLAASVVLMIENAVKMFGLKSFKQKIACYVIDFIVLLVLSLLSHTTMVSTLCMVILSEFYLSSDHTSANIAMMLLWEVAYAIIRASSVIWFGGTLTSAYLTEVVNDCFIIFIHFVIMTMALRMYHQNLALTKTVVELNKTNAHLQEAYEKLAETTAIEERQKIAKDIHDTAGHSITTVIMQTEAARLTIDKDPEAAKLKIAAASQQARNALEELRTSIHLLSGKMNDATLKELLERIVSDSMNGTDVVIRANIENVKVDEETALFLCNTLKEGLANGMRHGGATAFLFELTQDDYAISFLLSDNGTGVDTGTLSEGFGLSGMRTRAEALGGIIRFSSQKGEGFEIDITLPKGKKNKEERNEPVMASDKQS
ncbi:MAG: sensor histidine kinase [Christensenellaceae bacterium]